MKKNKTYFEGWYFKNTNGKEGISFIPGISINKKERHAFIQVITKNYSCYIKYDINRFNFSETPFYIKIGNSVFSKKSVHIDIDDEIKIFGNINYSNSKNIATSILKPNIMGPFSYFSFMECNHAIISMKSIANGTINISGHKIEFNDDIGYIEKDWGSSFPKCYIWAQGNDFKNQETCFMISVADIPFKICSFKGVIASLIIEGLLPIME